jgi:hypothetical protein
MNPLRKKFAWHDGLTVSYGEDVTEEQVRQIDELVRQEFEDEDWVIVEQES